MTNSRTLLTSEWVDAPASTRTVLYVVVATIWVVAVVHSVREHRKNRAEEARIIAEARNAATHASTVASPRP